MIRFLLRQAIVVVHNLRGIHSFASLHTRSNTNSSNATNTLHRKHTIRRRVNTVARNLNFNGYIGILTSQCTFTNRTHFHRTRTNNNRRASINKGKITFARRSRISQRRISNISTYSFTITRRINLQHNRLKRHFSNFFHFQFLGMTRCHISSGSGRGSSNIRQRCFTTFHT